MKKFYKRINYLIIGFLSSVVTIALIVHIYSAIRIYQVQRSIADAYETQIKPLVPIATEYLKTHPNDWIRCTDVALSSDDINNPKIMANWIAYYRYGARYCNYWWQWKGNPCDIIKNADFKDHFLLAKKIELCELAQKAS